jgi:hypothetical protein
VRDLSPVVTNRPWLLFILAMVLSVPAAASEQKSCDTAVVSKDASSNGAVPEVTYDSKHRQLRVVADGQPLSTVLDAISISTGIEFINEAIAGCELVHIRFDFMALDKALARVLRGQSYILRTVDDGKPGVWLLPPGQGERLIDTDTDLETFYAGLQGNRLTDELAEQIKRYEAEQPGAGQRTPDARH